MRHIGTKNPKVIGLAVSCRSVRFCDVVIRREETAETELYGVACLTRTVQPRLCADSLGVWVVRFRSATKNMEINFNQVSSETCDCYNPHELLCHVKPEF